MTYHPVTMVTKSQAIIFWNIGKYISLTIKSPLLFFCIIWTHFCLLKNTKVQISQILRIEIPNVGCAKRRIVSRSRSFGSSRNAPPFFGAGLVGAGGRLSGRQWCDEEESGNVFKGFTEVQIPKGKAQGIIIVLLEIPVSFLVGCCENLLPKTSYRLRSQIT